LLEEQGHSVRTPTLTGLGERSHLAHPGIVMETHIDDVSSVLTYEDLREDLISPQRRPAMEALIASEGFGWLLPRYAAPPWEQVARQA
jgi:hypothetical protein